MQGVFSTDDQGSQVVVYDGDMRTTNKSRPACGARLAAFRQDAGLSQKELADRLGIAPSNIGFWELHNKPPRSDILPKLAKILNLSVDDILGTKVRPKTSSGPQGRTRKVFQEVSKLPRRQQQKIVDVVEALVSQNRAT